MLQNLANIYNALLLVNTKGEDTIIMGDCLKALRNIIGKLSEEEGVNGE